jgi:hypothetical protein
MNSNAYDSYGKFVSVIEDNNNGEKLIDKLIIWNSINIIAEILFNMYKDKIVYVRVQSKPWYEFKNNLWSNIDEFVIKEIIEEIKYLLLKYIYSLDKSNIKQITKLLDITKKFDTVVYKYKIMKSYSYMCIDNDFPNKLNNNKNLIAFNNGVYDLTKSEFRITNPSDNISLSVGYDFKEYDEFDVIFDDVYKLLSKIIVNKDTLEYLMNIFASIISNRSNYKKYIFKTNDASKIMELLKQVLGDYFSYKPKINPWFRFNYDKGQKVLLCNPTNDEFEIIKYICPKQNLDGITTIIESNVSFSFFSLYFDDIIYWKYFVKMWKRVKIVSFESEYINNYHDEFNKLKQPIMWLLLKKYNTQYVSIDESEQNNIYEYNPNIVYSKFIEECVVENKNKNELIARLYCEFKEWYCNCDLNKVRKCPLKQDFISYFKNQKYKMDLNRIYEIEYICNI